MPFTAVFTNFKKSKYFYPLLLLLLTLILSIVNFKPGTFLSGWDTLHPEFDFKTNFFRLFFGVWRSDQGLGALAGHSHMADLPRFIFLWLNHFIFPLNFLRYFYVFACLALGPLGVYYFLRQVFIHSNYRSLVSFLGSLVYLFSLSTTQQFYVPFEMFTTQWALLPWILNFTLKYLSFHHKKDLLFFALFSLLATPQAYAAHLWYPFFGLYLVFLFLFIIINKTKPKFVLILTIITMLVNSFWVLPNIYYVLTSSSIPRSSHTNRISSQEFLLRNRETGNIADTALIKGFYLNWDIYDFELQRPVKLMQGWNNHLKLDDVSLIAYLIFTLSISGIIISFWHKKNHIVFLPFFVVPFALLANKTFPLNHLFDFLISFPILQELFRFIFTKVSILALLGLTIYLSIFLEYLFSEILPSFKPVKFISIVTVLALIIYAYPQFTGNLISDKMKIELPAKYFQFWKYSNNLPDGRFLTLPLHTNSGWQYYDWGYQGSGFIWFGSKQSYLDRDSDRWNPSNERAYYNFFYSLYSSDISKFVQNLYKYQVSYILWDPSLISTNSKNKDQATYKNEIALLLSKLSDQQILTKLNNFDDLELYQVNQNNTLIETTNREQSNNLINDFYNDSLATTNRIDPFKLPINCNDNGECQIKINNKTFTQGYFSVSSLPKSLTTKNQTVGVEQYFEGLPHYLPYIIAIKSKHYSGIPTRICLWNNIPNLCIFDDELSRHDGWDYYLIPPSDEFSGYTLKLNNITYANDLSQTRIDKALIIPLTGEIFDYIQTLSPEIKNTSPQIARTIFPNKSLVAANLEGVTSSNLIFNQSYHPAWLAFYFNGLKPVLLPNHTIANGWVNAWDIPSQIFTDSLASPTVYILFWPQLLQFLGFGLLIGTFAYILIINRKTQNNE